MQMSCRIIKDLGAWFASMAEVLLQLITAHLKFTFLYGVPKCLNCALSSTQAKVLPLEEYA